MYYFKKINLNAIGRILFIYELGSYATIDGKRQNFRKRYNKQNKIQMHQKKRSGSSDVQNIDNKN